MNIIQIQIANDLNPSPKIKSLKMFNIFGLDQNLCQKYQTFKKSILETMNEILGFLPLFYLIFEASKIPQFNFQKF